MSIDPVPVVYCFISIDPVPFYENSGKVILSGAMFK